MRSVVEIIKAMALEPEPQLCWSVGEIISKRYVDRHGTFPPTELRPKTYGRGSHQHRVYPETYWPEIEELVRAHNAAAAQQSDLFAGADR